MKTIIECWISASATRVCAPLPQTKYPCSNMFAACSASSSIARRPLSLSLLSTTFSSFIFLIPSSPSSSSPSPSSKFPVSDFFEIPNSGGVKALDLLEGSGEVPSDGDQVAIHYYGRLAAKQGWRFDSTYDHKDDNGEPDPFVFVLGSGKVIAGIEVAVRSMKVGDSFFAIHSSAAELRLFWEMFLCYKTDMQLLKKGGRKSFAFDNLSM
ncbi:hypothetical protein Fmac_027510 [Flemingia macrophylla]|uniref:peptidylprolyl isomerase n=1 Tax=Flemingia macrophylla TaxID=520843 RepID=A0ABD1LI32_9FABA